MKMNRIRKRQKLYIQAFFCIAGFILFPLFIHRPFPYTMISVAGLALPARILAGGIKSGSELSGIIRLRRPHKPFISLGAGMVAGVTLAGYYRHFLGITLFPESLTWFALLAALIGGSEEFIFRGIIQGYFSKISLSFAVVFAAFAHSGYKTFLFTTLPEASGSGLFYLFAITFGVGLLAGVLKEFSGSIVPPILGHVVFDILVYGQSASAPWWVW
ncbi:CPBP family glutamic-type intramembrane protease [Gaoshiqia sp. Z1-71]|uniref:CPBP family glutamic-type intramembrane protease n=1 Tax=Gaoshiqia hydrogeniformans TaxID=3290090 RepID=UPI003BF7D400